MAWRTVLPLLCALVCCDASSLTRLSSDKRMGFVDVGGHVVIPFAACGELTNGWHYIDRAGNLLAGPFQAAYPFRDSLGIIVISNRWGILGRDFKFKVEPRFEEITMHESGSVRVKQAGKWGLLDSQLNQIAPCDYDWIGDIIEGKAAARRNDRWAWVLPKAESTPELRYDFAGRFSEGRAAFGRNEKYGFVDSKIKIVIREQYDEVLPFSEGIAWVRSGTKWLAIDPEGQLVFPGAPYVSVTSFHDGISLVATVESIRRGEFLMVNRIGKVVWPRWCESRDISLLRVLKNAQQIVGANLAPLRQVAPLVVSHCDSRAVVPF